MWWPVRIPSLRTQLQTPTPHARDPRPGTPTSPAPSRPSSPRALESSRTFRLPLAPRPFGETQHHLIVHERSQPPGSSPPGTHGRSCPCLSRTLPSALLLGFAERIRRPRPSLTPRLQTLEMSSLSPGLGGSLDYGPLRSRVPFSLDFSAELVFSSKHGLVGLDTDRQEIQLTRGLRCAAVE
jgi:hypothetical protein